MSTSDDSNWSFSRTFTTQFQASRFALESRIAAASNSSSKSTLSPETIQELSISLANLTKTLAGATGSLPSYDQKQYELQLKELERSIEALRASNVPKSKFAFKRRPAAAATNFKSPPSESSSTQTPPPPLQTQNAPPTTSTHLSLSSHSHRYLTREDLPSHTAQSDLSISDLDHCIVNLLPSALSPSSSGIDTPLIISALHARNLSDCVVILPAVDGSALIHDLERCVLVLGCHQFRMHASSKVDVHLSITSNPIIEHCKEIRFSSYPRALAPSSVKEKLASFSVQDFSHIRATPSPNYVMKDGADTDVCEWPLATVNGEELERVLGDMYIATRD